AKRCAGTRNIQMGIPKIVRLMASATEKPTPMASVQRIKFRGIAPAEVSYTWSLKSWTAGSAKVVKKPKANPMGTSHQGDQRMAISLPSSSPLGIKATSTPCRKRSKPRPANTKPRRNVPNSRGLSRSIVYCVMSKRMKIGPTAPRTLTRVASMPRTRLSKTLMSAKASDQDSEQEHSDHRSDRGEGHEAKAVAHTIGTSQNGDDADAECENKGNRERSSGRAARVKSDRDKLGRGQVKKEEQ